MVNYVDTHFDAGHDLDHPKLRIDLGTLLTNLYRVLDRFGPPATTRQRVAFLVRQAVKQDRSVERIMGRLDTIKTALDAADATAADEHAQVTAHLDHLSGQVAELQATIDGMVADQVTDEDIADLAAQAEGLAATIEGIDTEGDTVPEPDGGGDGEPTPEPTPEPAPEIFEDGTVTP